MIAYYRLLMHVTSRRCRYCNLPKILPGDHITCTEYVLERMRREELALEQKLRVKQRVKQRVKSQRHDD